MSAERTNFSCTAPQKQVAVASSSVDHPSLALPARGRNGLDLSAVEKAIVDYLVVVECGRSFKIVNGAKT